MDILDLETTVNPDWWIKQLTDCDWTAGHFLYTLLQENRFHERYGKNARVLLLTDGTKLASFCSYAEKDEIPDTALKPWLGFVYTYPEYRGRRLMGKLICRAKELAREDGYDTLYLSTREEGLYEKYGAEMIAHKQDSWGEESRIFRMNTYGFYGWENALVPAKNAEYPGIRTPRDLYTPCGTFGKKKPARRGCSRTGTRRTGRWGSARLLHSWRRTSSADRFTACRWRMGITIASTRPEAVYLT